MGLWASWHPLNYPHSIRILLLGSQLNGCIHEHSQAVVAGRTEKCAHAGSEELPAAEQGPPQQNGPPVKLVHANAPPQPPATEPQPQPQSQPQQQQQPEPVPMTQEAPQPQPATGEPQVLLRLVKPEEADVVAKQVELALSDIHSTSSMQRVKYICQEQSQPLVRMLLKASRHWKWAYRLNSSSMCMVPWPVAPQGA